MPKFDRSLIAEGHPGRIIAQDFIDGSGVTPHAVAVACGIKPPIFYTFLSGKRPLSAQMALRLGRYFGVDPQWFVNMQAAHDLDLARVEFGAEIERTVMRRRAA